MSESYMDQIIKIQRLQSAAASLGNPVLQAAAQVDIIVEIAKMEAEQVRIKAETKRLQLLSIDAQRKINSIEINNQIQ